MAEAKGWQVSESISALAMPPGGRTVRVVYENLRTTMITDLRQAMACQLVQHWLSVVVFLITPANPTNVLLALNGHGMSTPSPKLSRITLNR